MIGSFVDERGKSRIAHMRAVQFLGFQATQFEELYQDLRGCFPISGANDTGIAR